MESKPRYFVFRVRAFISLLTAVSAVAISLSGVILYVAPSGRIAQNWTVWSLPRGDWLSLHLTFSAVFMIAAVLHLCFNLKCFLHYLKIKSKALAGWRWEWLAVAILTAVVAWGTLKPFEPFTTVLDQKQRFHRRPPAGPQTQSEQTGMGQLTLNDYCRQSGLDVNLAISTLKATGIAARKTDSIRVIADRSGVHPSRLREILAPARHPR